MHKTVSALASIGRRLIGGFQTRDARYYGARSKYMPHQGAQEIARRQRQAARLSAIPIDDNSMYPEQLRAMISNNDVQIIPKQRIATDLMTSGKPVGKVQDSGNPVGRQVTWTSSNTKKVGNITHVVPAGQVPADVGAKVKDAGQPRDHESFVVSAVTVGAGVVAKVGSYWPRASLLNFA